MRMKLVVFGLTVSSSWGNGHATLWRGLMKALARRGHHVVFFERDVPYYAGARDLWSLPDGELVLFADWDEVLPGPAASWPTPTRRWSPRTAMTGSRPRSSSSIHPRRSGCSTTSTRRSRSTG
jgi:hypothetical protein